MRKTSWLACIILLTIISQSMANPACPGVHTWHTVSTQSAEWLGTVTIINQKGGFVDEACHEISQFKMNPNESFTYGMYFEPGSDFNFAYTLALVQQDASTSEMISSLPVCHFLISAFGPANPQIITSSMNNATCDWQPVPGVGENFQAN